MNTEITVIKIDPTEFGLEPSQAQEVESVFLPVIADRDNLMDTYTAVIAKPITNTVIAEAKKIRMQCVKIRTNTDKIHKSAKAFYLAGGRFVDAWKNKNNTAIGIMEENLFNIEDTFAKVEREELAERKAKRVSMLTGLCDNPEMYDKQCELMTEAVWANMIEGMKLIKKQKADAEAKSEQERIDQVEKDRVENERIRIENEALREAASIAQEAAQRVLDAAHAESSRKAADAQRVLEAERAERSRVEAELVAKKELDRYALRKYAEALELIEINKEKANKKPDKQKLLTLVKGLTMPESPVLETGAALDVLMEIYEKFELYKKWAEKQINENLL